MTWIMSGKGLPEVEVEADSFDEAIREARKIAKEYCMGEIEKEEKR